MRRKSVGILGLQAGVEVNNDSNTVEGVMLIVSLDRVPGKKITATLGLTSDVAVIVTGITDNLQLNTQGAILGGNSPLLHTVIQKGTAQVLTALEEKAGTLGANAVVGTRLSHELSERAGQVIVAISIAGTAVKLEDR